MQNIAFIKDQYAALHDGQLIDITNKEANKITPEAFKILKDEFVKRGLDMAVVEAAEQKRADNQAANALKIREGRGDAIVKEYWAYALAEMKQGNTYQQIFEGLLEQGAEEDLALKITEGLEIEADKRLRQQKTNITTGAVSLFFGVTVTILSIVAPIGSYSIIAYGAVVLGGSALAGGLVGVVSYNKILSNCIKQRELLEAETGSIPATV